MRPVLAVSSALLVLTAAGLRTQQPQPTGPTFAVQVEAVSLDVLVTDNGRPVSGLQATDFSLQDNGVAQRIVSASQRDRPVDLYFVIDRSYSVTGAPLVALREAARMLVDELEADDRAALLTFSHELQATADLSADKRSIRQALDALQPSGATSLSDAVYASLMLRDASLSRAIVLVFSDGRDTSSWTTPSLVLDLVRQTDVVLYGVTLRADRPGAPPSPVRWPSGGFAIKTSSPGSKAESEPDDGAGFLEEIAGASGGQLFTTDNPKRLRRLFLAALRDMKARYTITYTPQGVEQKGWHAIDVGLTRRKGKVTARAGYVVP
jgi:VWFA-related protein